MQFTFNLCDEPPLSSAERKLDLLLFLTGIMMQTKDEQTAAIEALAVKAEKVKAEILAAVAVAQAAVNELKAQVATAGNSTPAMDAAMTKAAAALDALDALNPDAIPPVGTI